MQPSRASLLRPGGAVTNVELFFDLVYVFAVTQLAHLLVEDAGVQATVHAVVLLVMVWQVWVYTTWFTNYFDPNRPSIRVVLLILMLASLVLAAEIPRAFDGRGALVAGLYVGMQIGRGLVAIWALRGETLQLVFLRIMPWSVISSVVVVLGATVHGYAQATLWAASVAIDLGGAAIGFYVPGLGGSRTVEWTITGEHFAERCQAFVLIALGESIVVSGSHLSGLDRPAAGEITAFVISFATSAGLWWVYFDRAADDSSRRIAESDDPGRLARNAFHWVHPLIVAGVIAGAAADEVLLANPTARGQATLAWLLLGGAALFLGGHALFKAVVWQVASWPRLAGVAGCLLLALLAPHVTAVVLAGLVLAVIVAVCIADRLTHPMP